MSDNFIVRLGSVIFLASAVFCLAATVVMLVKAVTA